jgi:hypothetical protein
MVEEGTEGVHHDDLGLLLVDEMKERMNER